MTIQGALPQYPLLVVTINNPSTTPVAYGRVIDYTGNPASGAGTPRPYGVLQVPIAETGAAAIGVPMSVAVAGIVEAEFASAAAIGDPLTVGAGSALVVAVAGQPIFARALQAITAAGQRGLIEITKEGIS